MSFLYPHVSLLVSARRKFKMMGTSVLTPPEKVVKESETDDGTIGKVILTFTEVPERTRVDWVNDIELKGVWMKILGPLAKRQIQKLLKQELEAFAKYVESRRG